MQRPTQPGEIAREAIKRLATRRQPPTPENFARAYAEVEGRALVQADWPATLRSFLQQWEGHQSGLTQARKREMFERVLINFGSDPDQLALKLANLARSWAESGAAARLDVVESAGADTGSDRAAVAPEQKAHDLALRLAQSLKVLADGLRDRWEDLAAQADRLAEAFAGPCEDTAETIQRLGALWREILVRAEDDQELLRGLQGLLEILFRNMADLAAEDAWSQGQLRAVGALLKQRLNPYVLHEAEQSLQAVIARQSQLRDDLREAQRKLKDLVATFIDRIGELSSSTDDYHDRLQGYAERIAQAEHISELAEVIEGLTADMGSMRETMRRSHEELKQARSQVEAAERRIQTLEQQLAEASAMVRSDQLTGALNRRGMEEAFERELSRVARLNSPLSVALLDIDHFKRLNDSLGHQAGDRALVHLAQVVRQLLRPTDSLARYGGEEFLILLPNTAAQEAEKVMQRVQRELTRQFFLHDNQRVLITFSAGVVELEPGEGRDSVIARADAALYRAKTSGRNRVVRG